MRGLARIVALMTLVLLLARASEAFAFREQSLDHDQSGCAGCHQIVVHGSDCETCHTHDPADADADGWPDFPFEGSFAQRGPHGVYLSTTARCSMCHTIHDADTSFRLLPGETAKATCQTCHDGTAGFGVYGTIARRGLAVGGGHAMESTNVVPGGDAATGGDATVAFRGPGGTLTCSDCHSPHDSNTVAAFTGERIRVRAEQAPGPVYSDRLLKRRPTGATTDTPVYGSDWCLGCHKGRGLGAGAHDHPVESSLSASSPYSYDYLPTNWRANPADWFYYVETMTADSVRIGTVGNVVLGSQRHNTLQPPTSEQQYPGQSAWLMIVPRAPLQAGHAPICQQCHEDSRDCGELSADGSAAIITRDVVYTDSADGFTTPTVPPNPRFQNFPHETQNANMLVEVEDDLCTNCHLPVPPP